MNIQLYFIMLGIKKTCKNINRLFSLLWKTIIFHKHLIYNAF